MAAGLQLLHSAGLYWCTVYSPQGSAVLFDRPGVTVWPRGSLWHWQWHPSVASGQPPQHDHTELLHVVLQIWFKRSIMKCWMSRTERSEHRTHIRKNPLGFWPVNSMVGKIPLARVDPGITKRRDVAHHWGWWHPTNWGGIKGGGGVPWRLSVKWGRNHGPII